VNERKTKKMRSPIKQLAPLFLTACLLPLSLRAATPVAPDWALPSSPTHKQIPPPEGFHRPTVNFATPLGMFEGQSDIGGPLVSGSASYDAGTKRYTLTSAGYNIWYNRDEFRYVWKRISGDASLSASITFPDPKGYFDRKVVLIFRQDLDDDAKEIMVALHGGGLIHLAQRPEKNAKIKEACRLKADDRPAGAPPIRLGIEKRGDTFALFVSLNGEPLHQVGTTADLHLAEPFYVGIGFCSHLPVTSDTAILSDVVLRGSK
jgi:hypothetical protein